MAYPSNVDSEVLRVVHHYWRHGDDIRMTVSDHAGGRRAVHLAGPRERIHRDSECRLSVGAGGSVAGWGLVAQGGVPPVMVVFLLPVGDDHPGMGQ
jgi:hypothetical protein